MRALLCFMELVLRDLHHIIRETQPLVLQWDVPRVSVMPQFFANAIFRQVSHLKTIEYLCQSHVLISIFTSLSDLHGKTACCCRTHPDLGWMP